MMVINEELLDIGRNAVQRLRESGESCLELKDEGYPGVFLCKEDGEIPPSYVKLVTISMSEDDPERFDIYTY